jgi:hypothetical protein
LAKLAFNKAKAKVNWNLTIFTVLFIAFGGMLLFITPAGFYYFANPSK